jgi:hypothetical protein
MALPPAHGRRAPRRRIRTASSATTT